MFLQIKMYFKTFFASTHKPVYTEKLTELCIEVFYLYNNENNRPWSKGGDELFLFYVTNRE